MRILICDDEAEIRLQIKNLISGLPGCEKAELAEAAGGEELLRFYGAGIRFDILFIDIELGDCSGIDVAREIRQADSRAIIIFVSGHSERVFDVFSVEALHFIVKPIRESEFKNVFFRAVSKYQTQHKTATLAEKDRRYNLAAADIIYAEGYNRRITVYTAQETVTVRGKLTELFRELQPHGFVQIHQGFIVNMDNIRRIDLKEVVLRDGRTLEMSKRKRHEALLAYDSFIQKGKW